LAASVAAASDALTVAALHSVRGCGSKIKIDQDQGEDVMKKTILHMPIRGASLFLPAQKEKGFEEGMAAYKRGDYATALKKWRLLAEAGDATAQYNLGVMYAEGQGVPQDDEEAAKWFRLAAEQGHADAQRNLGVMYILGQGVPQDFQEAAKWYRKAAEQGDADAQCTLGEMYEAGQGVPQNRAVAYALYSLAASDDPFNSTGISLRDALAAKMTPNEIEEGQRLAKELKEVEFGKPGSFGKVLDAYLNQDG
jgi:hypothetical protein